MCRVHIYMRAHHATLHTRVFSTVVFQVTDATLAVPYVDAIVQIEGLKTLHALLNLSFLRVGVPNLSHNPSNEGGFAQRRVIDREAQLDCRHQLFAIHHQQLLVRTLVPFLARRRLPNSFTTRSLVTSALQCLLLLVQLKQESFTCG